MCVRVGTVAYQHEAQCNNCCHPLRQDSAFFVKCLMEWNCSAFKLVQNAIPICDAYDDRMNIYCMLPPIRLSGTQRGTETIRLSSSKEERWNEREGKRECQGKGTVRRSLNTLCDDDRTVYTPCAHRQSQ